MATCGKSRAIRPLSSRGSTNFIPRTKRAKPRTSGNCRSSLLSRRRQSPAALAKRSRPITSRYLKFPHGHRARLIWFMFQRTRISNPYHNLHQPPRRRPDQLRWHRHKQNNLKWPTPTISAEAGRHLAGALSPGQPCGGRALYLLRSVNGNGDGEPGQE